LRAIQCQKTITGDGGSGRENKIFVILTGPARGYVKKQLKKMKIPFKHLYLQNYQKIAKLYNLLDCYIISSRLEGGPLAILEVWASGIPLISTKVGMVADIAKDGFDSLLAETEDAKKISQNIKKIRPLF